MQPAGPPFLFLISVQYVFCATAGLAEEQAVRWCNRLSLPTNSFGNEKEQKDYCSGAVDVPPHKKRLRLFFFPLGQRSCSGKRPAKQGLSLSKQIAMGLW